MDGGGYLTATNWSFGWWRNWGCRLSQPGADGKGRAWEWVGEGGRQPEKGPNTSTMEQSWVCSGAEEQIEIFTDPEGKKEKKKMQPQGTAVPPHSGSCPAAGDSAAALVLLGAGAGGVGAVHCRRGQPDHPVGCEIALLAAQHLSPGCPKGFPAIHPDFLGVPVPCGALWWQLAKPWRAWLPGGVMVGTPIPTELHPLWLGWLDAPHVREPTRPQWHRASHPALQLPGDMRGFPLRASSQILPEVPWRPPGGCCLWRGA